MSCFKCDSTATERLFLLSLVDQRIIDETKLILNFFSEWFVNHTFKEANFMAHNVTKGRF